MAKKKSFSISNNLTRGLEETVSAAQNYSGDLRLEVIPLAKVELDPNNPRDLAVNLLDVRQGIAKDDPELKRKTDEFERLQSLAATIRDTGIINPILVYMHANKYRLIAGERRTLASIIAGKKDIQAKVLEHKPSALKLTILQWVENIEREDLSLWERLSNLSHILAAYGKSHDVSLASIKPTKIRELIGCSLPHAMNYRAVLSADEGLKLLIRDNKIKNLEKAAVIARIAESDLQQRATHACLNGATLRELKSIANQTGQDIEQLISNKAERRGRSSSRINLGFTRQVSVVRRLMMNAVDSVDHPSLQRLINSVDWDDFKSVSDAFKKFILILEDVDVLERSV